jgi:N-acyl homoserine lactone hydrolase
MKIHAQAKPLHDPLPGGSQGAKVSVEPMIAGSVEWPPVWIESPPRRFMTARLLAALMWSKEKWTLPVPAFLIRHPSAGAILVDTGLHPAVTSDARENFGRLGTRIHNPKLPPGDDVPTQLRERGLSSSQIGTVVMTHLHYDHASAISEFPQSTIVLSETEWLAATGEGRASTQGYRPQHYDFVFDYRTVDFDRGGISSYATFGRTFDLFGDGSVRLAYTPGHTAGHISVIARMRQRDFVIGGDVVLTWRQLEQGAPQPRPFDPHQWRRSLQELRLFRREFPNAVITPGHDASFYQQLDERYE